jgi:hypothetical protein
MNNALRTVVVAMFLLVLQVENGTAHAATLAGHFVSLARGTVVNLTAEGSLDWVHWGLYSESSLNRKANVSAQIQDFRLVAPSNFFGFAYQFADNWGGYSWSDGTPELSETATTTGVYSVGLNHGFQLSVDAGTGVKTLRIYLGTYGASGKFQASLSDNSAPAYVDTSLSNSANGPNGMYQITFAGRSPGSKLNIKWTVETMLDETYGNVTLQAATLSSTNANNSPFVELTSPVDNASFAAAGSVNLTANAVDFDGTIAKVEFFRDTTKLGEDLAGPYTFAWTSVEAGKYSLWARVTDNKGATASSEPVEIFVTTSVGTLNGSVLKPPTLPTLVSLTAEGTSDWIHWGARTNGGGNADRKAGVVAQISDYHPWGDGTEGRYSDNYTAFSWSDGTPTESVAGTKTGVFITGATNGFELILPADTSTRTVKIYVGLYAAKARFQAWLSDFSAQAYADTSLSNFYGNAYAAYTLSYSAASAGQTLTVRFAAKEIYDPDYGNVTMQAASLVGGTVANSPPSVAITNPTNGTVLTAPASFSLSATASDNDGTVDQVQFFDGSDSLGTDATTPYSIAINALTAGTHSLRAVATDNLGATATSMVTILVNNPPSALLTYPTNDAWFAAPANITLTATAADTDGSVTKVEFFEGATKLGEDLEAPYSLVLNNLSSGSYSFTVSATDNHGAATTSPAISVAVINITPENVTLSTPLLSVAGLTFNFATQVGRSYAVQFASGPNSVNWQLLTNVVGTGSTALILDSGIGLAQKFYRVKIQ